MVEEVDEAGVKTGDSATYLQWVVGIGCSATLFVLIFVAGKKRKDIDKAETAWEGQHDEE